MKDERPKRVKRLINRLTTGTWKKVTKAFRRDDGYCILGAISQVYQEETGDAVYDVDGIIRGPSDKLLTRVANYYGFVTTDPSITLTQGTLAQSLLGLNDESSLSIKELGELMEVHAKEVFIDPPRKPKKRTAKPKAKKRGPTLTEFIGGPLPIETRKPLPAFVDAHLAAEKRREKEIAQ